MNLLEKQLSTVYFKDIRFLWVTLYVGVTVILEHSGDEAPYNYQVKPLYFKLFLHVTWTGKMSTWHA